MLAIHYFFRKINERMIYFLSTFLRSLIMPLRIVLFFVAILPLFVAILVLVSVGSQPITQRNWSFTHNDIQRAKKIVRHVQSNNQKTIQLNEKDLNLAFSYLLNYYVQGWSHIEIKDSFLHFRVALLLNNTSYVNFSFNLSKQYLVNLLPITEGEQVEKQYRYPVINTLKIGRLEIADEFAALLLESIIKHTSLKEYYILVAHHIKGVEINNKILSINYMVSVDLDLKDIPSLNNKTYQSVLFYQQQITKIIAKHNPRWRLSLAELLQPLFKLAYQRSTKETAVTENSTLLIAVSTYVNKQEIQHYFPFDIAPQTNKIYPTVMYGRRDMAQHFILSAVLAATGAETLAHFLGQEKEVSDTKSGGSGFSFIDLASDKAGLHFGKSAVESPAKARLFQKKIAKIADYTAFMPRVSDLPENMNTTVFKQKFESIKSDKYQQMIKEIDQRISNLAIYKSLG